MLNHIVSDHVKPQQIFILFYNVLFGPSACMSVYLPASLPACLPAYLTHNMPVCLSGKLQVCPSAIMSLYHPVCISTYLSVSVCPMCLSCLLFLPRH